MGLTYEDQMMLWRKRRERAMALREAGLTLEEIGDLIGCSRQRAWQILGEEKERQSEKREGLTGRAREGGA